MLITQILQKCFRCHSLAFIWNPFGLWIIQNPFDLSADYGGNENQKQVTVQSLLAMNPQWKQIRIVLR